MFTKKKDYTYQLNKIADEAGMLKTFSRKSLRVTAKETGVAIKEIFDYYASKDEPISLICGDDSLVKRMTSICPQLNDIPVVAKDKIKEHDFSVYKNCTIIVVDFRMIEAIFMQKVIYDKFPICRVNTIFEYLEFNDIVTDVLLWKYKSSKYPSQIKDTLKVWYYYFKTKKLTYNLFYFFAKNNEKNNINILLYRETIYCANKTLKNNHLTKEERQIYLKKLMGFCVVEKDIIGLKDIINTYINEYDKNYKKYLEKIDDLINDLKEKIASRKSKDIILNWLDSISNERLRNELPFLYELSEQERSLKSEHAYTAIPWTSSTMKTIMSGEDPVKGRFFSFKQISGKMKLPTLLKSKKYQFQYFGNGFFQHKVIPRVFQGMSKKKIRTFVSTEFIWGAMNHLAMAKDEPQFLLIHQLFETHKPFFSPVIDDYEKTEAGLNKEEKLKSSKWIDDQYRFYVDIMGNKSMQIYMGDHGDMLIHQTYLKARINVMFFVRNTPKKIDFNLGVFSLRHLHLLIEYLMDWNNEIRTEDVLKEYAITEDYDKYEKCRVNDVINDENWLSDSHSWMQLRVVHTKEYAYVLFCNGDELLFKLPDEEHNLIDNSDYREVAEKLRDACGKEFINIYEEEFFKNSRLLYEKYESLKNEKR